MTRTKQVFRPTITDSQMLGVVEVLQHHKAIYGLSKDVLDVLVKFEKDLVSISYGVKSPAYIATGVREERKVSVENLEAMSQEQEQGSPTRSSPTQVSMSEADLEAELERLDKEMRTALASEGNQNVILEDRRQEPRE